MKIGIVGCGMVGSTAAFGLLMEGIGREIILVDLNRARAEAEADDIFHAVPFAHPLKVRAVRLVKVLVFRVVVAQSSIGLVEVTRERAGQSPPIK